jgi:S-DNA-T family DNA segregation ATPase FtsK/SpoIIIE
MFEPSRQSQVVRRVTPVSVHDQSNCNQYHSAFVQPLPGMREIRIVCSGLLFVWTAAALATFSPSDASLFNYVVPAEVAHNWCGQLGANVAAFLYVVFGAASWVLVGASSAFILPRTDMSWGQSILRCISGLTATASAAGFAHLLYASFSLTTGGGILGRELFVVASHAGMFGAGLLWLGVGFFSALVWAQISIKQAMRVARRAGSAVYSFVEMLWQKSNELMGSPVRQEAAPSEQDSPFAVYEDEVEESVPDIEPSEQAVVIEEIAEAAAPETDEAEAPDVAEDAIHASDIAEEELENEEVDMQEDVVDEEEASEDTEAEDLLEDDEEHEDEEEFLEDDEDAEADEEALEEELEDDSESEEKEASSWNRFFASDTNEDESEIAEGDDEQDLDEDADEDEDDLEGDELFGESYDEEDDTDIEEDEELVEDEDLDDVDDSSAYEAFDDEDEDEATTDESDEDLDAEDDLEEDDELYDEDTEDADEEELEEDVESDEETALEEEEEQESEKERSFDAAALVSNEPFELPVIESIFQAPEEESFEDDEFLERCEERGRILEEKLTHFGISGKVVGIKPGPVITLFEYEPEVGNKVSKILSLEDDLALSLKALSIRIIAPVPGMAVVGFEIANEERRSVSFAEVAGEENGLQGAKARLPLALGVDIVGNPVIADLAQMPHLLVAGATGAGKSVGMNAMLVSLLARVTPDRARVILIDPKRLEFAPYSDIPHLLFPIVTNPYEVAPVLKWVAEEMELRYELMAQMGVRNIADYHKLDREECLKYEREIGINVPGMPYMVIMIDELADLMMVAGREIETLIARIAQMARAAGIHMLVATQRPSVDIVTGLIKANFPSRIAFRVSSKVDSRTIIDAVGAEKLLGKGDMLYMSPASVSGLQRLHGAYVSDDEVDMLTDYLKDQRDVRYFSLKKIIAQHSEQDEFSDPLYEEVKGYVDTVDEVSISLLQRKYRIGFNRSARLIEMLERDGIVAPAQGGKPRRVMKNS